MTLKRVGYAPAHIKVVMQGDNSIAFDIGIVNIPLLADLQQTGGSKSYTYKVDVDLLAVRDTIISIFGGTPAKTPDENMTHAMEQQSRIDELTAKLESRHTVDVSNEQLLHDIMVIVDGICECGRNPDGTCAANEAIKAIKALFNREEDEDA